MQRTLKALSDFNLSTHPKVLWSLLIVVCLFGTVVSFFEVAAVLDAIRGHGHWILSAQDRSSGMTIWVRRSDSALPTYTVVVEGYRFGRNIAPLVIDRSGPGLPQGITRLFEDTGHLPGRCTLRVGPLTLDVMQWRMVVNDATCKVGRQITVRVPSPP